MKENITAASNVIPFDFRGHSVRAVTIEGEPWFVASDVCRVLDVTNTTQAMQALDEDERSMFNIGRQGQANIVNESGLYTLILRSRDAVKKGSKPHAFRKWVTAEVLPAIRKNGAYDDTRNHMPALMDELLGKAGALRLSNIMRCRVAKLDAEHQRSAVAKLSSAVHACFGVPRIELIPGSQFQEAAKFIASYSIEGEYIPAEKRSVPDRMEIDYPLEQLLDRRPGMLGEGNHGRSSLSVGLRDLMHQHDSPCEQIMHKLTKAGYNVEAAWFEIRTFRNRVEQLSWALDHINSAFELPQDYAVDSPVGRAVA